VLTVLGNNKNHIITVCLICVFETIDSLSLRQTLMLFPFSTFEPRWFSEKHAYYYSLSFSKFNLHESLLCKYSEGQCWCEDKGFQRFCKNRGPKPKFPCPSPLSLHLNLSYRIFKYLLNFILPILEAHLTQLKHKNTPINYLRKTIPTHQNQPHTSARTKYRTSPHLSQNVRIQRHHLRLRLRFDPRVDLLRGCQ